MFATVARPQGPPRSTQRHPGCTDLGEDLHDEEDTSRRRDIEKHYASRTCQGGAVFDKAVASRRVLDRTRHLTSRLRESRADRCGWLDDFTAPHLRSVDRRVSDERRARLVRAGAMSREKSLPTSVRAASTHPTNRLVERRVRLTTLARREKRATAASGTFPCSPGGSARDPDRTHEPLHARVVFPSTTLGGRGCGRLRTPQEGLHRRTRARGGRATSPLIRRRARRRPTFRVTRPRCRPLVLFAEPLAAEAVRFPLQLRWGTTDGRAAPSVTGYRSGTSSRRRRRNRGVRFQASQRASRYRAPSANSRGGARGGAEALVVARRGGKWHPEPHGAGGVGSGIGRPIAIYDHGRGEGPPPTSAARVLPPVQIDARATAR